MGAGPTKYGAASAGVQGGPAAPALGFERVLKTRMKEYNERHERLDEEHRRERKVTERRRQKIFLDHEKWMRIHAVSLGSHYKLIREMRDKLR